MLWLQLLKKCFISPTVRIIFRLNQWALPCHALQDDRIFSTFLILWQFFLQLCLVACKPSITIYLVTNRTTGKRCCQSSPYGGCCIEYWEWQFSFHSTTNKTHTPVIFLKVPIEPVIYCIRIFTLNGRQIKITRRQCMNYRMSGNSEILWWKKIQSALMTLSPQNTVKVI